MICFLEIRGSMASVFVLLEAFTRKEAAALGFFPCATASLLRILELSMVSILYYSPKQSENK